MSRCFYLKDDGFVNLEVVKDNLQKMMNKGYTVKLEEYDKSEGIGGCIYIQGEAARGIHLYKEENKIVVKINVLSNYSDYVIARIILDMLNQIFEKDIYDEDDNIVNVREYFTDEKIQQLQEIDAKMFLVSLKNIKDHIEILGPVRSVYFGKGITKKLVEHENDPEALVKILDIIIHHIQYELPEYNMPGAALIRPKDSEDENDFMKIRMMFEGNNYILQDYDYLFIRGDASEDDIIFINNKDLLEISKQIFKKGSGFELADDFTIVFPKLEGKDWKKFIELARQKNHKELLNTEPAAKTVNLTPDFDSESVDNDEKQYQCHGDHWNCILENSEKEFPKVISHAVENASKICGDVETDYVLDEAGYGRVIELEYFEENDDPISIRLIFCPTDEGNQLVSMYPCVKKGSILPLKITQIKEWTNGLEGWITGELPDERELTFFDADYAIHKEEYEIGKTYNFVVGALAYSAEEPESKGFSFEGQQAIDFVAKMGKEPDYDENGNVVPIQFSTETLCAYFPSRYSPDDVEFITTVENVSVVKSIKKSFWNFDVIYRGDEETETKIPTFFLKSKENKNLDTATQLQGMLWLTGYLYTEVDGIIKK